MPLGTIFRTLALVILPAVFFALFLIGPWLAGTWAGARYVAVLRQPDSAERAEALRRYRFVYLIHKDWVKADRFCKARR